MAAKPRRPRPSADLDPAHPAAGLPWAAWRRADMRLDHLEAVMRHRIARGDRLAVIRPKAVP